MKFKCKFGARTHDWEQIETTHFPISFIQNKWKKKKKQMALFGLIPNSNMYFFFPATAASS